MPAEVKKVNGYQVSTPGGIKAKSTTKKKAEAQVRLLQGVEHGWKPTGKKRHSAEEGSFLESRKKKFGVSQ